MDRRAGQFDEAFARLHPLFEGARGETVLITERLLTDENVPWMTVPKALAEITKLRPSCMPSEVAILDEYEAYLHDFQLMPSAA